MKCNKCKKNNSTTSFKHLGSLCSSCYCRVIEKRIRKYARVNKFFKKNDRILINDKICYSLIESMIEGLPVKLVYSKNITASFVKKNKINKIVNFWTLDDENCQFLERMFFNKKLKKSNFIKLLKYTTDDEIESFAKFKKIKFSPNKKNKTIKKILDEMNNKYPETKFSLIKSVEEMNKILCIK